MSPRAWKERIEDILSCARNIRDYTEGMSFDAFLDDPKTIRAVAYEFTTIGEAARHPSGDTKPVRRYPVGKDAGNSQCAGT